MHTFEEICYLPVKKLLRLYRTQVLSPVDLLKAQISRIKALDTSVKAITYEHYDEALAEAKGSEQRYREGDPRPLEGVTCAIKDDLVVKGWPVTMGSLIRKDYPFAKDDAALVALLRQAGVIMHIQTNVPEYYCNLVTWNNLFGICRNPWNTKFTPGGSSGGSAVALALGFTTLAIGSDMGGSIRFPAAMTGLYGFEPPYGRVATSTIQYESHGPLARTFEDMVLFQNAITGPSYKMISTIRPKLHYPLRYKPIKGWKVAYDSMKKWGVPIDTSVQVAMEYAMKQFREQGAIVEQVDLGFRAKDFDRYALGIFSTAMGPFCFNEPKLHPELITPYIQELLEKYGCKASPQHIFNAEEWIADKHTEIQEKIFLSGFQAIIMPTLTTPYVSADMGSHSRNNFVTIDGKPHPVTGWTYSFTWPWNLLGQYPVVNVPIDVTSDGIPLGMQIISNTYKDTKAFRIAYQWSQIAPKLYGTKGMRQCIKPGDNDKK